LRCGVRSTLPHPLDPRPVAQQSLRVCVGPPEFRPAPKLRDCGVALRALSICAQFCAHHQTRPSGMDCRCIVGKPCGTRHRWYSITIGHITSKSLVLRATNPWAQGVRGSNPRAPTNLFLKGCEFQPHPNFRFHIPVLICCGRPLLSPKSEGAMPVDSRNAHPYTDRHGSPFHP